MCGWPYPFLFQPKNVRNPLPLAELEELELEPLPLAELEELELEPNP